MIAMLERILHDFRNKGYQVSTSAMQHSVIVLSDDVQVNIIPSMYNIMLSTIVEGQIHQRFNIPNIKNTKNQHAIFNKLTEWIKFYQEKKAAKEYLTLLIQKGYTIQSTKLFNYSLRLSKEDKLSINLDYTFKPFSTTVYTQKQQKEFNAFVVLTDLKNSLEKCLTNYQFTGAKFDQLLLDFQQQGYPTTPKTESYQIKLPNNIELKAELIEQVVYIHFFANQQLKMIRQAHTTGDFYSLTIDFCKQHQVFLII